MSLELQALPSSQSPPSLTFSLTQPPSSSLHCPCWQSVSRPVIPRHPHCRYANVDLRAVVITPPSFPATTAVRLEYSPTVQMSSNELIGRERQAAPVHVARWDRRHDADFSWWRPVVTTGRCRVAVSAASMMLLPQSARLCKSHQVRPLGGSHCSPCPSIVPFANRVRRAGSARGRRSPYNHRRRCMGGFP
jgi:hypothetical protein